MGVGISGSGGGEDGAAVPHRHEEAVPVGHAVEEVTRPEVRAVQFAPSGEVRMAPFLPTATKRPFP
jgi:hypothetical protein